MLRFSYRSLRSSQRGFALLIALILLAFLVILFVSLAAFTRVEVQVASGGQLNAQARLNAQLALNIAIGQLQKFAGPDQRTTATANLFDASLSNGNAINGLSAPRDGSRHWTGVWGNPDIPDRIYTKSPTPILLNWLVSGNESASVIADIDGRILAPAGTANALPFNPNDVPTDISGSDPSWLTLVGKGTVADREDYVVAKIQPIKATNVEGVLSSGEQTIDRYAWWVGDEGVKARYDLRDKHADSSGLSVPDSSVLAGRYRLMLAQRNGIERVSGYGDYLVNAQILDEILDMNQLSFVESSLDDDLKKHRFHDMTLHSMGVLADTQRGGLRGDLTAHFSNNDLTGKILPTLDVGSSDLATQEVSARNLINSLTSPRWEILNSYYQQVVASAGGEAIAAVAGDANVNGITPVIVQLRMLYRLRVEPTSDPLGGCLCYFGVVPVFVLGNPYNVPLKSEGVDFRFHSEGYRSAGEATTLGFKITGDLTLPVSPVRLLKAFNDNPSTRSLLGNVVFRTPAFEIPPGELKVFVLAAGGIATGSGVVVFDLLEGEDNLDVDRAADLPIGMASVATAFNDSSSGITGRKWTLNTDFGVSGREGQFSISMYPAASVYPSSSAQNPMTVIRPLQRIQEIGLGGVSSASYTFNAPDKSSLIGASKVAFMQPYYARRQYMVMPLAQMGRQRIYADYNIRAQLLRRPLLNNAPGSTTTNPLVYVTAPLSSGGAAETFLGQDLPPRWGRDISSAGVRKMVLFDLRQADDSSPILSVAALRHANMSAVLAKDLVPLVGNTDMTVGDQSGVAVGNSWTNPYVRRDLVAQNRNTSSISGATESYFDLSYLLNSALWDGFFFSTIPQVSGAPLPTVLPNSRMIPMTDDMGQLKNSANVSAHLMLNGAFNINSTSVEAWKAVLSGVRFGTNDNRYLRSLYQTGSSLGADDGANANAYEGYRVLTDSQIDVLASQLVEQVRLRGPFMSLAHFINRKLVSDSMADASLGLQGALQTALDQSVNSATAFENKTAPTGSDNVVYADPDATIGAQAAGIPGWLTQGDVLQSLGPTLASRSDTFVIRAYGDVLDSINSTPLEPKILARAWCEAVVQRVAMPVNRKSENPADSDYNEPANATFGQPDFGRRFQIISFRWLSPDDI